MIRLFIIFFISISCTQNNPGKNTDTKTNPDTIRRIEKNTYDSLTIPEFFKQLITNHKDEFSCIYHDKYKNVCEQFNLDSTNDSNYNNFYTFLILHDLFTCKTAENNSTGDILNIPYMWHWVTPNPRKKIHLVRTSKLLFKIRPPEEFSKYNSYAEIDRTPYLYLSDLVKKRPKYYNSQSDTFATFGWCSEREMAFVSLMELLGYNGKISAPGVHSWSECIVPMVLENGEKEKYKFIVDNTFDDLRIEKMSSSINEWENAIGDGKLSRWYNKKASSEKELKRIKNHIVPKKAAMRIENKIVKYLNHGI